HAPRGPGGAPGGVLRHLLRLRDHPPPGRERAPWRGIRRRPPGRRGDRDEPPDPRRRAPRGRPARRDVLRLSRGGRLVLSRPQGWLARLLSAVLAGVAPLLEEHRRVPSAVLAALESDAGGGAAEHPGGAVEPGADVSWGAQL